ncbi:MAG: hypothetical protein AAGA48_23525 [Myxococcota bacterium]
MRWLAAGVSYAARVVCDPDDAARILDEARIAEPRVPIAHPELVPGLARRADPASPLARVLQAICSSGDDLSVRRGLSWTGPGVAAYEIVVSRAADRGCSLQQERVPISVGVSEGQPAYRLLNRPPADVTPGPDCEAPPVWRDTSQLDQAGPVTLRLWRDRKGGTVVDSAIEVWWASGEGWQRQTLAQPAPDRYHKSQGGGPAFQLGTTSTGTIWVVASHDRTPPPCQPRPGQTVWKLEAPRDQWQAQSGRPALTALAREGLWQLAGDPGWLLVLAQDEEVDEPVLGRRMQRLQRRVPETLHLFRSASFPLLNPGYLAIAPGPWPNRDAAEAFRSERPRRGAYVKQAWSPLDPCAVDPVVGD